MAEEQFRFVPLCEGLIVLCRALSWSMLQLASEAAVGVWGCRIRFRAKEKAEQVLEGLMTPQ